MIITFSRHSEAKVNFSFVIDTVLTHSVLYLRSESLLLRSVRLDLRMWEFYVIHQAAMHRK